MTRTQLIERLMKIDLKSVLQIQPTKGELKTLSDSDLAQILSNFDAVNNLVYSTQRLMRNVTVAAYK